ncbi:MAG: hypothetical protein PHQ20_00070 [Candidatus Moranbacteria bacterium]|nr:hypothetical protein [Candidatus Moranbacteria bacterium]
MDKSVQWMKEMMKDNYGTDYTDEESREAAYNFINFYNLLLKIDMKLNRNRCDLVNVLRKIIEK